MDFAATGQTMQPFRLYGQQLVQVRCGEPAAA